MKELFILGAGASYASAGTPLGKDLVWTYYHGCFKLVKIKGNNSPDLTEENRIFKNFFQFWKAVVKIFPELKPYISKFESWRARNWNPPLPNLQKRHYIDEMVKDLQEENDKKEIDLIRQLTLEHITEKIRRTSNKLYPEFVNKVLAGKPFNDISVISFNFDSLLLLPEHELKDFNSDVSFDYRINFATVPCYRKQEGIPLIKPNGSLDWAFCSNCKSLELLSPVVYKNTYDKRCCRNNNCKAKLQPFIFLPHENKSELSSLLKDKAGKVLKNADKIVVIGYSFPEYDIEARELFRENVKSDADVEIVDYCDADGDRVKREKNIRERLKTVLPQVPQERIKISLDGFQGYLNNYKNV